MGQKKHSTSDRRCQPRRRTCLCKVCRRPFTPKTWNQRYCGALECLIVVRRWQAQKRQQRRRALEAAREKHRKAERDRRRRKAALQREPVDHGGGDSHGSAPGGPRGHAANLAERVPGGCFCDRPGCFSPVRTVRRGRAHYCSLECLTAVRRVLDRERKWRLRRSPEGKEKRAQEYVRCRTLRRESFVPPPVPT
jgi:hypothetical protein